MRITVGGIVARVSVTAGVLVLFLAGASSARQGPPPRSLDASVRSLESIDLYALPSIDQLGPAGTMTLTAPLVLFLDDTVIEGELEVIQP